MSLNGILISSLTPHRWVQFNFNVSFPFDLSKEDTSPVSGVPPSHNAWVPWVTTAFIAPTPSHLLLIVTSGLITWNSCLSSWMESKNLGALKSWKHNPSPRREVWKCQAIYLLFFPKGPCLCPPRLPFPFVLTRRLGNGASASPRK